MLTPCVLTALKNNFTLRQNAASTEGIKKNQQLIDLLPFL